MPEEQRVQALVPLAGLNLPASHMTQAPDEPRTKPSIPQIGQHSLGSTETETDVYLVCKKEGLQTGKDLSVFKAEPRVMSKYLSRTRTALKRRSPPTGLKSPAGMPGRMTLLWLQRYSSRCPPA